jgi:ABC-2 type transport system permease protein
MWTEFRYALNRSRGQVLGWGLALAALGLFLVPFYDVFVEQKESILQLFQGYPKALMAFFGDILNFFEPAGYLDTYFSYLPVIVGIFAVLVGSGLVAGDEESGRLDLVLAQPVSRTGLFFGRLAAFVVAAAGIMAIGWFGFSVTLGTTSLDVTWGQMALPFLSLGVLMLVYGALALLLSMLLPSRRLAATTAGTVMVASYFLSSLSRINEDLKPVARFLPHDYYQGGSAVAGVNLGWLFALLGASVVLALLAWVLFLRRDIRVSGEGGWRLPAWSLGRGRRPPASAGQ